MRDLWLLIAGCAVGLVWGIVLSYSHSLTFAEFVCRVCRERNEAELNLNEETPND